MSYKLIYNGYTVEFLDSEKACYDYIENRINEHKNLNPQLIYNHSTKNKTVIVYQYNTFYCEMFMIIKPEKPN